MSVHDEIINHRTRQDPFDTKAADSPLKVPRVAGRLDLRLIHSARLCSALLYSALLCSTQLFNVQTVLAFKNRIVIHIDLSGSYSSTVFHAFARSGRSSCARPDKHADLLLRFVRIDQHHQADASRQTASTGISSAHISGTSSQPAIARMARAGNVASRSLRHRDKYAGDVLRSNPFCARSRSNNSIVASKICCSSLARR